MRCEICERFQRTSPAKPANIGRAREVGQVLAMDFSYQATKDGLQLMILHLIDEASRFHVARVVKTIKAKTVINIINNRPQVSHCLPTYTT